MGGLLSGCLLGWFFTPFYIESSITESSIMESSITENPITENPAMVSPVASAQNRLSLPTDVHSLKRRWPLALLLIVLTIAGAIIAIQFVGG